ncbi:uncharacterized protein LOC126686183 [Mercurialis annua]|uniref:uncharacterized protein LOC126686183 n=1 Tax=Mercurialis annua TaxID=3986 RepID=UPI00215F8663|nr:uncharacterized protein LOC126686183 [Mercurialis annua]
MAKREMSTTLKNLKFMQRAAVREEITKKPEEEKIPDGNFVSLGSIRKCMVIMEGDPQPGASIGRISFQSFNPSVDKLNEEASNGGRCEESDVCATTSSDHSGKKSFRGNGTSLDGVESSNTGNTNLNDLKRKQLEAELEPESQHKNKSPKTEGDQQSFPNSNRKSFKQPKKEKLDWNVLRPKSQNNQKKRG